MKPSPFLRDARQGTVYHVFSNFEPSTALVVDHGGVRIPFHLEKEEWVRTYVVPSAAYRFDRCSFHLRDASEACVQASTPCCSLSHPFYDPSPCVGHMTCTWWSQPVRSVTSTCQGGIGRMHDVRC